MMSSKRGRPKNDRIELAVSLRLRAYENTNVASNDLEYWLFQAGYSEEEKKKMGATRWSKLKNTCSVTFTKRRKTIKHSEDLLPLWEKTITRTYIRFEDVPQDIMDLYSILIDYIDNCSKKSFKNLTGVNLQQIDITDYINSKVVNNKKILHYFKIFFKKQGMEKIGVLLNDLICNAMKNKNDNFDFQDPHQDYFPVTISTDSNKKLNDQWLAWSAIVPISKQGSWITIWYDLTSPRTIEIKYGQMIFFRSDVVHCGGRPRVDTLADQTYYRLHFYLQTKIQKAPDNKINKFHLDGRTYFNDLYTLPPEKKSTMSSK